MDMIFNPPINDENQYIDVVVGELRTNGYQIHALDDFFSSAKHFKSIKLVHLNWFENVDDSNFFVALRSFIRKFIVLSVIRISGKSLVWTMHNRTSHEKALSFFSRAITRLLIRWSHRIIIHAQQSESLLLATYGTKAAQKAVYIPHPNFIGVYGDVQPDAIVDDRKLHVLFTGMVKPYKNLELLMEAVGEFGNDVQLTLAGKAIDAAYERQVREMANRVGNVALIPHFIPNDELAALLAKADILVLPYDLASSLNSGTVLLAFSYQKTVICPEIGTIMDLGERQQDVFHYRYQNDDEHRQALRTQLIRATAIKQQHPEALREMGKRLYAYVRTSHDQQQVGERLAAVYRQLTHNSE